MLVSRALDILDALRRREAIEFAVDEQMELLNLRLVNVCSSDDYGKMRNAVRDFSVLSQKVRSMARELDTSSGPMSSGFRRGKKSELVKARELYTSVLARLEDAAGKKAAIEALVYNSASGFYVSLALEGRRTLSDMNSWKQRFGSEELGAFINRMHAMRNSMELSVLGASSLVDQFMSPRPGMIKPELRPSAIIASQSGVDAERFEEMFALAPETHGMEDYPEEDELLVSTYLSSATGGQEHLASRYSSAHSNLFGYGLGTGNAELKALALTDTPMEQQGEMVDRMRWLKEIVVLPDENDIAWLARSPYTVLEVKSRYEELVSAVVASGYQENSDIRTACAIMAGSALSVDVLTRKFDALVGQLRYVFDAAYVAAAMLASGPLDPDEAMHVFKEAVGVVSRANFFDDAGEVENLALLIVNRYGTDAQAIRQPPPRFFAEQPLPEQPSQEDERRRQMTPWYYWYYWHNRYYGRPMYRYYRTHPGHMHTVPHFG